MLDIRIVESHYEQPVLFGKPLKITQYRIVNWETEQPVDKHYYESMGEAERASYAVLRPYLRQMTDEASRKEWGMIFSLDRCNNPDHEHCFQVHDYAHRVEIIHHGRACYEYPVVPGYEHVPYLKALSVMTGLSDEELERMGEAFDLKHGL